MYIIQSSLILAAFYLFYKLLCSRDTLHRFNRGLLLLILALSAVIPCIHIDLPTASQEVNAVFEELTMNIEPTEIMASEVVTTEKTIPTLWQQIPWHAVFIGIYIIGLVVCLARFAFSLLSIVRLIRKSQRQALPDGTILIIHDKAYGPFSWMRYIIVSAQDLHDNRDMILAHERAHIRLRHSWDLLFAQLCATAQWFNPAVWLLKRELEAIHEYEADSHTLRQGFDARQYQLRLFEAATGVKFNTITNNFNNCSTKKRIIMMLKQQTSPWARLKALFVLPVALVAVVAISCTSPKERNVDNKLSNVRVHGAEPFLVFTFEDSTEIHIKGEQLNFDNHDANFDYLAVCGLTSENIDAISVLQSEESKSLYGEAGKNGVIHFRVKGKTAKDMTTALAEYAQRTGNEEPLKISIKKPATIDEIQAVGYAPAPKANDPSAEQGEIFQVVEEQPMFPGGVEELMKFLQTNIRYPKEAQERGLQGRVVVQFVVNKDGSICDEHVVRSVDPQLDAEALRVVRSMPNWTPGKQRGEAVRVRFTLPVTFRLS